MPGIPNPDIEIALEVVLIRVNGLQKMAQAKLRKERTNKDERVGKMSSNQDRRWPWNLD